MFSGTLFLFPWSSGCWQFDLWFLCLLLCLKLCHAQPQTWVLITDFSQLLRWNSNTLASSCQRIWLIGKDSDARRDWGQEEKGTMEDDMAGWHHRLNGCEFEWTLGGGDGQGGLACYNSWGHKQSDTTERLNWTELNWIFILLLKWSFSVSLLSCRFTGAGCDRVLSYMNPDQSALLF